MFARFTERARAVVVLAQEEARSLKHDYVGDEHLLLGLLRDEGGPAARVLGGFDVTIEEARAQVHRLVGVGGGTVSGTIPFTPEAKRALEDALRESMSLGHDSIGPEHLLLALARQQPSVAAGILNDFDLDYESIRREIVLGLGSAGRDDPLVFEADEEDELGSDTLFEFLPAPGGGRYDRLPLVLAIVLAAVAFPLGLLAGYLIWA